MNISCNLTYIQCISEFECDGLFIHKFIDFFQISYEITLRPSNQSKHQYKVFFCYFQFLENASLKAQYPSSLIQKNSSLIMGFFEVVRKSVKHNFIESKTA